MAAETAEKPFHKISTSFQKLQLATVAEDANASNIFIHLSHME